MLNAQKYTPRFHLNLVKLERTEHVGGRFPYDCWEVTVERYVRVSPAKSRREQGTLRLVAKTVQDALDGIAWRFSDDYAARYGDVLDPNWSEV